jgi:annexin A7/11
MNRRAWLMVLGALSLGSTLGCQSNPYKPTMFQRRGQSAGPDMGMPVQDGPFLGTEAQGGYPMPQNGAPPQGNFYPQPGQYPPGTYPPPGNQAPPIQGFPQTMPPAPGQLPQGPPPKQTPATSGT